MESSAATSTEATEVIDVQAIDGVRASISGEVFTPVDPGYDGARAVWNAMIDRRPAVIIRPHVTADVVRAVGFAREQRLPISVRGGGHNVAGHAVGDAGVMIDLSAMRGVRVDAERRRAWVEGGATWGDVDAATQAVGLATPGGLISDTGVSGLTLSGGIGWLRSRYGLCIDNLISADVITADGRLVHAAHDENPDLLWALKGGGGNFGVVTTFEFALHPVGPTVMFCGPVYPIEAGSAPIRFWRNFLADKNDRVGSLIEFSTIPSDPAYPAAAWGRRVYTIAAMFAGDADEGEALLQPLRELGEMVTDFSGQMDYCEVQRLFDTVIPFGQHRCYWKSQYLNGLTDEVIDLILEGNARPPSPNTLSSIWNFGGATAAVGAADTAFGDRSMPFMVSIDSIWSAPEDDAANIAWTRDFWARLAPHSHHGRIYLNFAGLGEDNDELVRRSYGANFERLTTIKRTYDPDN
ncbi:MAG: FAD-binding oxidoreductase, partial [Chloroflexi bacterium]|nr:FAD-binding oxidoreductase [Chloroflexota bacterium]